MQYLTLLITLPITVFAVLLVLSNSAAVTLYLLPDDAAFAVTLPLWQIALFVWLLHQKARFRFWQESRKAARLEKELEKLHAEDIARKDRELAAVATTNTAQPAPAQITAQG